MNTGQPTADDIPTPLLKTKSEGDQNLLSEAVSCYPAPRQNSLLPPLGSMILREIVFCIIIIRNISVPLDWGTSRAEVFSSLYPQDLGALPILAFCRYLMNMVGSVNELVAPSTGTFHPPVLAVLGEVALVLEWKGSVSSTVHPSGATGRREPLAFVLCRHL